MKYVVWSRGMSWMSGILILSYRLKEVINSYVFHCFWSERIVHIARTRCLIDMGFRSKCSINGEVIYIEKSKLKIVDMWLISLDRVTCIIAVEWRVHKVWTWNQCCRSWDWFPDWHCLVLDSDVNDSVLGSVLSLNDLRAWDETISRPANVAY